MWWRRLARRRSQADADEGRAPRPSPGWVAAGAAAVLAAGFWVATHLPEQERAGSVGETGAAPQQAEQPVDVRTAGRALNSSEASAYLGDSACARCHAAEAGEHGKSRHSRTLRRVTLEQEGQAFALRQTVLDPVRGLTYRTHVKDGRGVIEGTDGRRSGQIAADYVLGTGRNAMTFLAEGRSQQWMKMRLSYYPAARRWDFTPAQLPQDQISGPQGIIETAPSLEKCLLCHTTVLRKDSGQLNLARSTLGIGCERCHGPGKPHVERVGKSGIDPGIERLAAASPARINQICGSCHHSADNVNLRDPRVQRNLPRFQGPALEQSACYQKSSTLSCLTCHDAHRDASPSLATYDATCRSCHSAPRHVVCRVNRVSGCTSCHMPSQGIEGIPHARYRHHWIKVWQRSAVSGRRQPAPPGRAREQF